MEKKKILIAETNGPQNTFIKDALIRNNINVEILDEVPVNSEEMKYTIIKLKPDIVITNEKKEDTPASDVIYEIQKDRTAKQPIFILVSGYPRADIEDILRIKKIDVYVVYKPYDFDKLANYIGDIIKNKLSNNDDFYKKWKEKYYKKRYIEIEKYLTKHDFEICRKLGIKVEKKLYTEHEFEVLNIEILAYYEDLEGDLSEEEKQFKKSLEKTKVSKNEYNELVEKINKIYNTYNL